MTELNRKNYNGIDLFKFIFAVIVVMIHAKPFADISETVNWFISNSLFNLAVPFFFMASGFLLFAKIKNLTDESQKINAIKKYVLHIFKIYLVWTILWLPLKILGWHIGGGINLNKIGWYILNFVLTGTTGDALWYLLALVFSAIVYALVTKFGKKRRKFILILSAVFYVIGVIISSYNKPFNDFVLIDWYFGIFGSVDNGLFVGLIMFSIGAEVAFGMPKLKTKFTTIVAIIAFIAMFLEVILVYKLGYNRNGVCELFSLPIVSLFLFLTVLNIDLRGNDEKYKKMRDYSVLIYVGHCYVLRILGIIYGIFEISLPNTVNFVVALGITMTFAVLVRFLTKDKNVRILKNLY